MNDKFPPQGARGLGALLALLLVYCFGCMLGGNPQPEPTPTDRQLDDEEFERFGGCWGVYVYDWERNCRYESQPLCYYDVVGCQEGQERNAYDKTGRCLHFNRCVPDMDYWPAGPDDVCHHDRSEVTFCPDAEVDCEHVETREQCEAAPQCQPALGHEWDDTLACLPDGFEPRYLGCVASTEECGVQELKRLGDGCILTSACAKTECPDVDCAPCETPEQFRACDEWSASFDLVRFDLDDPDLPESIPLAATSDGAPDPCVPASLGEVRYRRGPRVDEQVPEGTFEVWELLVPVRNDEESSICGFAGSTIQMTVSAGGTTAEAIGHWPEDLPCDGTTWIRVVIDHAPKALRYEVVISAVDSCGTGGGTIIQEIQQ